MNKRRVQRGERVVSIGAILFVATGMCSMRAQPSGHGKWTAKNPPRFEEFPVAVTWHVPNAPVKLTSRSERAFRTRLTEAGQQPPNFAGHYRFTEWGCGSECISGAVVDLETGTVFSPPSATGSAPLSVCQSAYDSSGVGFRLDSRLMVVRCGLNFSVRLDKNIPDAYYYVWEGDHFRQILFVSMKRARRRSGAIMTGGSGEQWLRRKLFIGSPSYGSLASTINLQSLSVP